MPLHEHCQSMWSPSSVHGRMTYNTWHIGLNLLQTALNHACSQHSTADRYDAVFTYDVWQNFPTWILKLALTLIISLTLTPTLTLIHNPKPRSLFPNFDVPGYDQTQTQTGNSLCEHLLLYNICCFRARFKAFQDEVSIVIKEVSITLF